MSNPLKLPVLFGQNPEHGSQPGVDTVAAAEMLARKGVTLQAGDRVAAALDFLDQPVAQSTVTVPEAIPASQPELPAKAAYSSTNPLFYHAAESKPSGELDMNKIYADINAARQEPQQ